MIYLLLAEFLKIKKSFIYIILIVLFIIIPFSIYSNAKSLSQLKNIDITYSFLILKYKIYGFYLSTLYIILFLSLIMNMEYKSDSNKMLFVQPTSHLKFYISKIIFLVVVFVSVCVHYC